LAYRCFKEVRNVCAHAGRMPNPSAIDAHVAAKSVATGLGLRGCPLHLPNLAIGIPVKVGLLEVQALCALLFTLVTTLDAQLSVSQDAENDLLARWRATHRFTVLPGDAGRRDRRLRYLSTKAGLPPVSSTHELYRLLNEARLVV